MDQLAGLGAPAKMRAKVKFSYESRAANQISLKQGTTIDILSAGAKGGWTKGVDPVSGKQYFQLLLRRLSVSDIYQ